MAKRSQKVPKPQVKTNEYVAIAYVEDIDEAKNYESLLKASDIPAIIKEQNEQTMDMKNIVVMVPEDFIDEAHVVIESQDAYDDFYDFALEDNEGDDFDADFLEESF